MKQKKYTNRKALLSLAVATIFTLASNGFASADFSAINENTGFDSLNNVISTGLNSFNQVNLNSESVLNVAGVATSTGGNVADGNTGIGKAMSGMFTLLGGFSNEFNLNSTNQSNSWWGGDFESVNDTTGAESENDAALVFLSSIQSNDTNEADAENLVQVNGDTGDNEANNNTGGGIADSGNAQAVASASNTANANTFSLGGSLGNSLFDALSKNETTGFDSENNAGTIVSNFLIASENNLFAASNESFLTLTTGDNEADSNTGNGNVHSGSAGAASLMENEANLNEMSVNIGGIGSGSIETGNDTTGANSVNEAFVLLTNIADLQNVNSALIDNNAVIDANTGDNSANNNTGNATMHTGSASGSILVDNGNTLNSNETELKLGAGSMDLESMNSTTGSDSQNDAQATVTNSISVSNSNDAELENSADIVANSGNNESDNNTGSSSMTTGNVSGTAIFENDLNSNKTKITIPSGMSVETGNDTTGADSVNNATAVITNTVDVQNVNESEVNNSASIDTNSGGNSSSFNTGSGMVSTGSASVIFGAQNEGNSNSVTIGN